MLVRSDFFAMPRMLADETERLAMSICLSSMMSLLCSLKTTAAPAERGGRRERPERPATKAGRTAGRNAMEDPRRGCAMPGGPQRRAKLGRASWRERVWTYG